MNINPINKIHNNVNCRASVNKSTLQINNYPDDKLVKELDKMSMINNVGFLKKDYELNLSHEGLVDSLHASVSLLCFFSLSRSLALCSCQGAYVLSLLESLVG